MGRVEVDFELCKGCGLCVDTCPRGVLVQGDRINGKGFCPAKVEKPEDCKGCALCALMCPDVALKVFR